EAPLFKNDAKSEEQKYTIIKHADKRPDIKTSLKIKKNYIQTNKRTDISDWITYYFDRYNKMRDILQNRDELRGVTSISRVKAMDGRQQVALIGMVQSIRKTFTGSTIIRLEDPTGLIDVSLKKEEVAKKVEEIVEDEVLGIVGTKSKDFVFAENVIFPEVPERPIKKAEEEVYAAFISDIHAGSYVFLANEFKQFIEWLNGKIGNKEQQDIANKIRYLFVGGDLVDGIGVYPGQEKELLIQDIYDQYKEVARYLAQIPEDVEIIIIPGNHDALKIAEPQHALFKDIAGPLYDLKNVTMLSNPAYVNIHAVGKFPGFDVLMYHGVSFDHIVSEVPEIRKYGYSRGDKIMEFLMRKRHLAPTHGSTRLDPTPQDFLLIDKIPDIFTSGHIHYTSIGRYKNITTINSGCFQDKTEFQLKLGHTPTPGRVPVFNLQTNHAKIMRFK
ncbi:MAG: DNA-directed DNA polymerase II small subunit, partial [Candidatus Omnitrophica bacterium]|nr:DNA-directed DNA polymerase II small subunit [Candidatus Omnitrophota bacterium]